MNKQKKQNKIRERREKRVRAQITGSSQKPRFSVFRSNNNIHVQLIDDLNGKTLLALSSTKIKVKPKSEAAKKVGEEIAKKALEMGIKTVVFDRGKYRYHGRIKAVAEGARNGGLKF